MEITEGIAENRRELTEQLGEMGNLGAGENDLRRIREAKSAYQEALDEDLRSVEAGRSEEEAALRNRVDSSFEALHEVFESTSTRYAVQARRLDRVADLLTYATALLAIALTAWFVRRDRNRLAEQAAIEESEERFRSLVQEGADLIWILDTDGIVRYVAPSVERALGHAVEDVVDRDVFEFLAPDGEGAGRSIADVLREPGAKITTQLKAHRADGPRALFEATFSNMTAHPGVGGSW